jgi:hypothetical protein
MNKAFITEPIIISVSTREIYDALTSEITNAGLKYKVIDTFDLIQYDLSDNKIAFLETGNDIAKSVMVVHEHYRYNNIHDQCTNIFVITSMDIFNYNNSLGMWHIDDHAAILSLLISENWNDNFPLVINSYKQGKFRTTDE